MAAASRLHKHQRAAAGADRKLALARHVLAAIARRTRGIARWRKSKAVGISNSANKMWRRQQWRQRRELAKISGGGSVKGNSA